MGLKSGTQIGVAKLSPKLGAEPPGLPQKSASGLDPKFGPSFGTPKWGPNLEPNLGPYLGRQALEVQIEDTNWGPDLDPQFGSRTGSRVQQIHVFIV